MKQFITADDGVDFPTGYEIMFDTCTNLFTVYWYGDPLCTFKYVAEAIDFMNKDSARR